MRTIIPFGLLLTALALAGLAFALDPSDLSSVDYMLVWMVFALIGALLATRRAQNPIGWLFLVIGVVAEGSILAGNGPVDPSGGVPSILQLMAIESWIVPYVLLAVLLILFPTGRPPTRRWWIPVVAATLIIPFGILSNADQRGTSILSIVFGSGATRIAWTEVITVPGLLGLFFAAAASLFRRRRSASAVERQQLKWVGSAGALLAAALLGTAVAFFFTPLRQLDPEAQNPSTLFGGIPFVIGLGAVPIAVSVAILRHRLYDIDLLINRTLVYGLTTGAIALAFFGGLVVLQAVLRPVTGSSEFAVAGATLASFAVFQPLRRRIQTTVDRRFYRSRYDAARVLDDFSMRLRDEVDLDAVRADLIDAVGSTVQPTTTSLWIRG